MIRPMLCTDGHGAIHAVPELGWRMEPKLDGWRWQVEVADDGTVKSTGGRNGGDMTGKAPLIEDALRATMPPGTVFDGELLPRFGGKSTRVPSMIAREPHNLIYVVFDVLRAASTDLTPLPYKQRREALELLAQSFDEANVFLVPTFDVDVELFDAWLEAGLEGAVCKALNSPYRAGKRSRDWIKVKPQSTVDARVIGWRQGAGDWAGRAGALELELLDSGVRTTCSPGRPLDPDVADDLIGCIVEIRHHGIGESGVPRHPVFSRTRPDLEDLRAFMDLDGVHGP